MSEFPEAKQTLSKTKYIAIKEGQIKAFKMPE